MIKDIAIIGVAGRFPNANTVEEFYENLKNGKDSIRRIDRKRIINTTIDPEKEYQQLAYIENIDCFDYEFFNIVPGEAKNMDPHQRILLEVAYQVFENAGYNPEHYSNTNTSVYVASKNLSYHKHAEEIDPTLIIGNLNSATAGRIARFFNLRGSASVVDSACSSSLMALYQACNELALEQAEYSLVCAVDLTLFPLDKSTEGIGIFSKDGKTRSFSATAIGTGLGEAVGCVLLKPLESALRDKDNIHAVIKGIAVNQDANLSATLTSPDSTAQAQVLTIAWTRADIDPRTLSYIEAHGTGTALGDPIEVKAIDLAFSNFTAHKQFCALSSVKTNIGHADSAAGMVGLIKTILSLKRKVLFPSLHFTEPNSYINFESSPVYVNTQFVPWFLDAATGSVRRAGVSSFGVIGTNCHVVLEEAPVATHSMNREVHRMPRLVTISAQSRDSLELNIKELRKAISEKNDLQLDDISFTLTCGRKHFDYRFCVVTNSISELITSFERAENFGYCEDKPKLIFVCSGKGNVSQLLIGQLCVNHSLFRQTFQSLQQNPEWNADNASVLLFAFQYSFCKLLEQRGIATNAFIGDGVGKITIAVLKGSLSPAEGIKKAARFAERDEDNLQERLHTLLKSEANGDRCLFIEMSPKGSISLGLDELKSVYPYYEVVALQEGVDSDPLMELYKTIYLNNGSIDWMKLLSSETGRRIELPGYKFKPIRCWIREPKSDTTKYLYELLWQEQLLEMGAEQETHGSIYVVFMPDTPLAGLIVDRLEESRHCIKVYNRDTFAVPQRDTYEIDWSNESNYLTLRNELNSKGMKIAGLIHLGGLSPIDPSLPLERTLSHTLFSQFYMTKVFDELLRTTDCSYLLITANSCLVTATESVLSPVLATSHTYIRRLQEEYPRMRVASLDVDKADADNSAAIVHFLGNLPAELDHSRGTSCVAYRQGKRYVPRFDKVKLTEQPAKIVNLVDGGVYVITGDVNGIGIEVANYFAEMQRIKLVILGRKPLRDNTVFRRIEDLGTEVRYFSINMANKGLTSELLAEVKLEFGPVRGVVHSAELQATRGGSLNTLTNFKETLEPILHGLESLYEATRNEPLDFFVVFSSNDSAIGTDCRTKYGSPNLFEESYVQQLRREGINAIAIDWPIWRETGSGQRFLEDTDTDTDKSITLSNFEGISALELIMQYRLGATLVSKVDLKDNSENPDQFILLDSQPVAERIGKTKQRNDDDKIVYVPQTSWTNTENKVASAWYKVLKKENLGLNSNFFAIGGHSLLGARIINRLEQELEVDLVFSNLVKHPTIRQLAAYIDAKLGAGLKTTFKPIEPVPTAAYYSVTHAQKRLWVLSQLQEGSIAYNEFDAIVFMGELDSLAFEKAFLALVERHEILRTTFAFVKGELKQLVHDFTNSQFDFRQMNWINVPDKRVAIATLAQNESETPFRLDQGPLLRAKLVQLEKHEHVFLFATHHTLCDEWSRNVMIKELLTLYGNFQREEPIALPPLKIHYKDYAHWYRQFEETNEFQQHRDYWLTQMSGEIPSLELPLDQPRPKLRTYKGAIRHFSISKERHKLLTQLGQQQETTLFMNLLAVVFSLLHRYTGQKDIIIGSSRAGRNHIDLEDQIGLYVHTLAIRTQFDNNENFKSLLKKVKEATLGAYEHELYPFDQLVDELNTRREMSRSALFDVMVDLHNTRNPHEQGMQLSGVKMVRFDTMHAVSKFDLTFHFEEKDDGTIQGKVEYNTDIFNADRIERMIEHFLCMLDAVGDASNLTVNRLKFLPPAEKVILDSFSTSTTQTESIDKTVIEMFEEQVRLCYNDTALSFGGNTLTYQELNEKSNQLAHYLRSEYGIGPKHMVGVFLERSEWSIVGILAILKSGAAYVPIDIEHPRERVRHILQDSAIKMVLTQSEYLHEFVDFVGGLCALDIQVDILGTPTNNLPGSLTHDSLAYVIYTSGSSGKPKGCLIEHRNLSSYVNWANHYYFGGSHTGNFPLFTSLSFDLTVTCIFCTLTRGKCLTICEQKDAMGDVLTAIFTSKDIDAVKLTPTHLSLVEKLNLHATNIKKVIVGGELLTTRQVEVLMAIDSTIELYNEYGPTETTVGCTVKKIEDSHAHITIGKPINGAAIHILDSEGMVCPIDVPGEICIGGSGVARGYLNPGQTDSWKFVANTFTGKGLLYLSGDRGRWKANGEIEFLGRIDDQVKIRGYRVEPGEVETALLKHPCVSEAVVIRRYDDEQVAYLSAYLVMRDSIQAEDIRKFLKTIVPDYMIPSFFVQLQQLPFTVNGKVDKQALPDPVVANREPVYIAPRHNVEKELALIWEQLFKIDRIGIDDNFFDLGGNSLKMMNLLHAINEVYPNMVKISDLYDYPTIKEISAIVNGNLLLQEGRPVMQKQSDEFKSFEL
jgi:amino acid adenylation domain-containing protein